VPNVVFEGDHKRSLRPAKINKHTDDRQRQIENERCTGRIETDIFPRISIPVVNVVWNYSPTEMRNRIMTVAKRAFTSTVNGIEHSFGVFVVMRLLFNLNVAIEAAIAQVNAQAQLVRPSTVRFAMCYMAST